MDAVVAADQRPRLLTVSYDAASDELVVQISLERTPDATFTPSPDELILMERAIIGLQQRRSLIPYLAAEPHWVDAAHTRLSFGTVGTGRARVVQQLDWNLHYFRSVWPVDP